MNLVVTCPFEGRDGAEAQGPAESPRQRGGGIFAQAAILLAAEELGEVRGRGGDEGLSQVRREQRKLAAEGGRHRAACKVSATQEQCNGLLPDIKIINERFQSHSI